MQRVLFQKILSEKDTSPGYIFYYPRKISGIQFQFLANFEDLEKVISGVSGYFDAYTQTYHLPEEFFFVCSGECLLIGKSHPKWISSMNMGLFRGILLPDALESRKKILSTLLLEEKISLVRLGECLTYGISEEELLEAITIS